MKSGFRTAAWAWPILFAMAGCGGGGGGTPTPSTPTAQATTAPQAGPTATPTVATIRDDIGFFQLITRDDPFTAYRNFPSTDEFTTGRLDGSEAHRPVVKVSLNSIAFGALQGGKLPAGARFPNGSVVFKQVLNNAGGSPTLYAVMRRDEGGPVSGSGWQWAEYAPDGSVAYSISSRGGVCISCHLRQQGPQNDLVRTFERQ